MSIFVGLSIIILLVLLIQNRYKPSILFFGLLLIYYFFGLISLSDMLKNFVNTGLITLVLLLIVSIALERTSFVQLVANKLFVSSFKYSVFRLSFFTSFFSAFLNNTAVVATMISVVKQNKYHTPSKLYMILTYSALFGGVVTLIGTSTNLIVNSLVIDRGLKPLQMFDFAYVGIIVSIIGAFVMYFITRFLPDNKQDSTQEYDSYFVEAMVLPTSKLVGKSIVDNKLRNLEYLYLSEIIRDDTTISPVNPQEIIKAGDILVFCGDIKQVSILNNYDVQLAHTKHNHTSNLIEVIISKNFTLINKKIKETNFRAKFDASVVSIKRADKRQEGKIGECILQEGDNLILAIGKDFAKHDNIKKNFYIINNIEIEKKFNTLNSAIIAISFFGVILLNFFGILDFIKGLFGLLVLYFAFGYICSDDIKRSFPYDLVIIIASSLGIASVMMSSGVADMLASGIKYMFGSFGVYGAFIGVYLFTLLLTEIITNNAAAALSFPIAYTSAVSLGVDYMPFVMAVAYGASASFMTPFGYQTNLMVASVGGYSFNTFVKSGVFVSIVYSLLVLWLVPLFFPF